MRRSLDPAVQRRRLSIELHRAREAAHLTQKRVADEFGWSLSKLIRIENGQNPVSRVDLGVLLQLYGVTDVEQVGRLQKMADDSRQQPWKKYRGILNPDYMNYLWYEGAASHIRNYHPLLVPGLLQTEAYALRLFQGAALPGIPEEVATEQAKVRKLRQKKTQQEDPPHMSFVLDEAIIPRGLGNHPADRAIMRQQLDRMLELNEQPNVDIRILLFGMESHVGLRGQFVLLEFPDEDDPDLLYLENEPRSITTRDGALAKHYRETFERLESASLAGAEANSFLERAIAELAA